MLLSGATPLEKRGRPTELPEANYSPVFRHQGFQGRSLPHFPKRINLLFSATKILTAVLFLIWGNPEKKRLSVKFFSYVTFGGDPAFQADYFPCSPRSFWRNKFLRQVAPTLPKANYLPVFRHQNSYRRSFLFVATPKKLPFRQVFLLCYFRGRHRFSSGVAP